MFVCTTRLIHDLSMWSMNSYKHPPLTIILAHEKEDICLYYNQIHRLIHDLINTLVPK